MSSPLTRFEFLRLRSAALVTENDSKAVDNQSTKARLAYTVWLFRCVPLFLTQFDLLLALFVITRHSSGVFDAFLIRFCDLSRLEVMRLCTSRLRSEKRSTASRTLLQQNASRLDGLHCQKTETRLAYTKQLFAFLETRLAFTV